MNNEEICRKLLAVRVMKYFAVSIMEFEDAALLRDNEKKLLSEYPVLNSVRKIKLNIKTSHDVIHIASTNGIYHEMINYISELSLRTYNIFRRDIRTYKINKILKQ